MLYLKRKPYLEPVQDLLHGQITVQNPAVPQRPLQVLKFHDLWSNWLSHCKQWQGEIRKGVPVCLDLLPLDDLVQFQSDQSCTQSRMA